MSKDVVPQKKKSPLHQMLANLSEQLEDVRTSTDESRGYATICGKKGGKHVSVTIEETEIGKASTFSEYDDFQRKSDYRDEVKRLYKQGLKQREIALRLGISQSLVSKLLHS